jgi:hypothetical protein
MSYAFGHHSYDQKLSREYWSEDAAKLRDFIGDNGKYLTHLVVLNSDGVVVWFNADGYSEEAGNELLRLLQNLGVG